MTSARLEASNSTGNVTSWKITAAENSNMPISIISPDERVLNNKPISMTGHASIEPKLAIGTSALLIERGA